MADYDIKSLQDRILDILVQVDETCKRHGLTYYILAGTLLGAIRHKGFIPWDDDIDIGMPRADYDRFIAHGKEFLPEWLEVVAAENDAEYPLPFAKVQDARTTLIERYHLRYLGGIYIDIFPLDGISKNTIVRWWHFVKYGYWKKVLYFLCRDPYKHGHGPSCLPVLMCQKAYTLKGVQRHIRRLQTEHPFCSDLYVVDHDESCVMPYDVYGTPSPYRFADKTFMGPEKAHEYLSRKYGDYMQLPKESARHQHGFNYLDMDTPYAQSGLDKKMTKVCPNFLQMNSYIAIHSRNKAKNDIDAILKSMGFKDLSVKGFGGISLETFIRKSLSMLNLLLRLHKNDVVVIQYPFKKFYEWQCRIIHLKGARSITLIHDLGTFRRGKLTARQEIHRLSLTDVVIVHNDSMKAWLEEHGLKRPMVSLDIFDYLSDANPKGETGNMPYTRIVYAGGFSERKNAFLLKLGKAVKGCKVDLYGGNLAIEGQNHVVCHGRVNTDQLISEVEADWGLVWDGDSTRQCSGQWGEYLKYNNPHKASCYIRAGIPLIVWKHSAMAPFITKEKIGICVESLEDLPHLLPSIKEEEYAPIKKNATMMGRKLQDGYFTRQAIERSLDLLKK